MANYYFKQMVNPENIIMLSFSMKDAPAVGDLIELHEDGSFYRKFERLWAIVHMDRIYERVWTDGKAKFPPAIWNTRRSTL